MALTKYRAEGGGKRTGRLNVVGNWSKAMGVTDSIEGEGGAVGGSPSRESEEDRHKGRGRCYNRLEEARNQ